jgi:dephospho-CoA kinase
MMRNRDKRMKIIGITGGIGVGKSTVLQMLKEESGIYVLEADSAAHLLMQPEQPAYKKIVAAFSDEVSENELLNEDASINRTVLSGIVFSDEQRLQQLNAIVHPEVKRYILSQIEEKRQEGIRIFVIEAALLIEDGYETICDELWYIHADEAVRIHRLMENRGYTYEKCRSVIRSQASEDFYRKHCRYVIENSADTDNTKKQVKELLKIHRFYDRISNN